MASYAENSILATIVDCEGCISISKSILPTRKSPIYNARIQVVSTTPVLLKGFETEFGGKIRKRKQRNANWKPVYEWAVSDQLAKKCLQEIYPHLRVKGDQARFALALIKEREIAGRCWGRNRCLSPTILKTYERLYKQCKTLNQRGL